MFEELVRLHPDRPAIVCAEDGSTLSYAETDHLTRTFALTLARLGVRTGSIVAVLLGSSVQLPVVYLAILRLRAIFVPLDPFWPAPVIAERLDLLSPQLIVRLPTCEVGPAFEHLAVTVDADASADEFGEVFDPIPEDLVYGIFTSGTTGGKPKCAMNYHRGLSNRFQFMTSMFAPAEEQVVLLTSGPTYDTSVWQLLWPLTVGARIVIASAKEMANLEQVVQHIRLRRITFVDFVPMMLTALMGLVKDSSRTVSDLASLRHVIVGGESVPPDTVHQFRRLLPGARFVSAYGPTEASIGVVFHSIEHRDVERVPLGRAISGCFAIVVDETLAEQPTGSVGQIVIGGRCVGAGYLHDQQRTARAFVDNPFPDRPGPKVYLTGDLGYVDEAGRLHFSGRMDHEIKVNGVRIELGEIERAAGTYPGVRSAAVVPFAGTAAASLALFVAASPGLSESGLRRHLGARLPRQLVPAQCFVLDHLPLSAHGKIDRQHLRSLVEARREAAVQEVLVHHTSRHHRLVSTIVPFLDGRRPGDDENFLDAGGDSLRAVAIVYALSRTFGVPLSVGDLLENPSVKALEALITGRSRSPVTEPRADDGVHAALMEADARMAAPSIDRWTGHDPTACRHVLLTGGTGYIGSRLASALLEDDDLTVTCLVRASSDDAATGRVQAVLRRLGLWRETFEGRLTGLAADLADPRFGLATCAWTHLDDRIDVIVHAAARVSFLDDYAAHRPHNVIGTAEVLRLAAGRRVKPLYHLSTLAVLNRMSCGSGTIPEDVDMAQIPRPGGGYAQSKWVAERILANARRAGALVTVLRLGEVMPAADNGEPNAKALTHLVLSTMQHLGIAPTTALRSDYSPVSYVAERVVRFVRDATLVGRTVHIFHPESVDYTTIPRVDGSPVARVPDLEFAAAVRRMAAAGARTDVAVLAALLSARAGTAGTPAEQVLAGLLTDNPRLFGRETCRLMDERGAFPEEPLHPHMTACRWRLAVAT